MNEIIERATQAVLTEAREKGADSPVDYGDAEQIARAVIAAIREPSEAMLRAADEERPNRHVAPEPDESWRAMIDAAITPPR